MCILEAHTASLKTCNETWAQNHFTLTAMVKKLEKQELAIEGLQTANTTLREELAALKASPSTHTPPPQPALDASGFTHTDAA
jgi:hypothetical protein